MQPAAQDHAQEEQKQIVEEGLEEQKVSGAAAADHAEEQQVRRNSILGVEQLPQTSMDFLKRHNVLQNLQKQKAAFKTKFKQLIGQTGVMKFDVTTLAADRIEGADYDPATA